MSVQALGSTQTQSSSNPAVQKMMHIFSLKKSTVQALVKGSFLKPFLLKIARSVKYSEKEPLELWL